MEVALYLLPVTLGDTAIEKVLPSYNREIIVNIKHFIVEDVRSARRFLKKVDADICIDELTFYPLNKHTRLSTGKNTEKALFLSYTQSYPLYPQVCG